MRNKFETDVAAALGPRFRYESHKFSYTVPHTYTPDFVDANRKIIIECKGYLSKTMRAAYRAVKAQHPEWKFYFIFQNGAKRIDKRSKTTYREWAMRNGFGVLDFGSLKPKSDFPFR